ncbi:hypothetical protein BKA70DRAFT_1227620 [Coprinopsis sp. MPI-PUGE-AT-0042]|nr:hypothetical protein BKA70DRAFT_1227620 [Coprinopsis sp. MPI-PUGE-AT-0042]
MPRLNAVNSAFVLAIVFFQLPWVRAQTSSWTTNNSTIIGVIVGPISCIILTISFCYCCIRSARTNEIEKDVAALKASAPTRPIEGSKEPTIPPDSSQDSPSVAEKVYDKSQEAITGVDSQRIADSKRIQALEEQVSNLQKRLDALWPAKQTSSRVETNSGRALNIDYGCG